MRFASIFLGNYIGIYNGMQLNDIFIDFTLCKYKNILIRGDNGSGKSTLMQALQLLPDSNDMFIPRMEAIKEIVLYDGPQAYRIRFIHGIKPNGDRDTTKAYFSKTINNQYIELNENGNVTSYKDILYQELELDSNFIALSSLSSEDKGLATKKPAERKRFVNSIIENLEVYNDIYKTLSKKSSALKSMTSTIASKLGALGDETLLAANLQAYDNQISTLNSKRDGCIEAIATAKSIISSIDPDGKIQYRYTELDKSKNMLIGQKRNLDIQVKSFGISGELSSIKTQYEKIKSAISETEVDMQICRNSISTSIALREEEAVVLRDKSLKLQALEDTSTYESLVDDIAVYSLQKSEIEDRLSAIGIKNILNISKDEFITALKVLKDIKDMVDAFKSSSDYDVMTISVEGYLRGDQYPDMTNLQQETDSLKSKIDYASNYLSKLLEAKDRLLLRSTNCTDSACSFIKEAIDLCGEDPDAVINSTYDNMNELNDRYAIVQKELEYSKKIIDCLNYIRSIVRSIETNSSILAKMPNGEIYKDKVAFFKRFLDGYSFQEINALYQYLDYANMFEEYKMDCKILADLQNQMEVLANKNQILEELINDINSLNSKVNKISNTIEELNEQANANEAKLTALESQKRNFESYITIAEESHMIDDNIANFDKELFQMGSDMEKIRKSLQVIDSTNSTISILVKDIRSVSEQREKTSHALQLCNDYHKELEELNSKYELIETIKYYSSPTTGIQLVFMELYMGKIIALANELLTLLFNGEFSIQPFIINESEFRIPCLGEGYLNDDVSSMSSAQVSMISMVLSFSFLHNSSTKFNVLRLDEIDGALDTVNRLRYTEAISKIQDIMRVEQCIMVSHNSESASDNVDIILLKTSTPNDFSRGNIIWKYM